LKFVKRFSSKKCYFYASEVQCIPLKIIHI